MGKTWQKLGMVVAFLERLGVAYRELSDFGSGEVGVSRLLIGCGELLVVSAG